MCCALGALFIAAFTAWQTRLRALLDWLPRARKTRARKTAAIGAMAVIVIAGSALAAQHFSHYVARAQANERGVLTEILAQPICGGSNS